MIYHEKTESVFLYQLPSLFLGKIIQRPSSSCRSPYVADVMIDDQTHIAHAPSLGCCGYADKDQWVYMTKHDNPKLCSHVIHLAKRQEKNTEYLIGIHPKSAEKIVHICLQKGCLYSLNQLTHIEKEKCFLQSRFDFVCRDKNNTFTIIEVKNVPCADYEDMDIKERKKHDFTHREVNSKISYFPDGYRKKKDDTVSPRALKHIQELQQLKKLHPEYRCILIFVIQRTDIAYFQASVIDPIYRKALHNAFKHGVEILPFQCHWNNEGQCFYDKSIPFCYK
jgi:DNA-binding sugar fermentation-stimulating protein